MPLYQVTASLLLSLQFLHVLFPSWRYGSHTHTHSVKHNTQLPKPQTCMHIMCNFPKRTLRSNINECLNVTLKKLFPQNALHSLHWYDYTWSVTDRYGFHCRLIITLAVHKSKIMCAACAKESNILGHAYENTSHLLTCVQISFTKKKDTKTLSLHNEQVTRHGKI